MARYKKINIDLFEGMFPNADPEDIRTEQAVALTNMRPYNGKLVKTNTLDYDTRYKALSEGLTEAQYNSIVSISEFVSDHLTINGERYDGVLIAIGINPTTGAATVYAYNPSDEVWSVVTDIETDTESHNKLFQVVDSVYLYSQINKIIRSWNAIRVIPGNASDVDGNGVTPLWVGWIDRDRFDEKVSAVPKYYICKSQIINDGSMVSLGLSRVHADDSVLVKELRAIVNPVDGTKRPIIFNTDQYLPVEKDFYKGAYVYIDGFEGIVRVESYNPATATLICDNVLTEIEDYTEVIVHIPDGYRLPAANRDSVKYYYKYSLVYDYAQESLLCEDVYGAPEVYDGEAIKISAEIKEGISARVTGVNIYRAIDKRGPYYRVSSIDLTREEYGAHDYTSGLFNYMSKAYVDGAESINFVSGDKYVLLLYDSRAYERDGGGRISLPGAREYGVANYELELEDYSGRGFNYLSVKSIVNNTAGKEDGGYKHAWEIRKASGSKPYSNSGDLIASGELCYFGPRCAVVQSSSGVVIGSYITAASRGTTIEAIVDEVNEIEDNSTGIDLLALRLRGVSPGVLYATESTIFSASGQIPGYFRYVLGETMPGLEDPESAYYPRTGVYTNTTKTILIPLGQGLGTVDDVYNKMTIYIVESRTFHKITDYDGATFTLTLDEAIGRDMTVNFYFVKYVDEQTLRTSLGDGVQAAVHVTDYYKYDILDYKTPDGARNPLDGEVSINVNGKYGAMLNGRLFLANVVLDPSDKNEKHDDWIAYSELGQPDVVPVSNVIQLGQSDEGEITGLQVLGDEVVVTKKAAIYIISVRNIGSPETWEIRRASHNIGNVSERGAAVIRGALYVSAYDGIYRLEHNNLAESDRTPTKILRISEPIQSWFNHQRGTWDVYSSVVPHYSPVDGVIHFVVYNSEQSVSADWIYNLERGEWYYTESNWCDVPDISFINSYGDLICTGSSSGDQIYSYTGRSGYVEWRSKVFRISETRNEVIKDIHIIYKTDGQVRLTVYNADTDEIIKQTILPPHTIARSELFGVRERCKRFYVTFVTEVPAPTIGIPHGMAYIGTTIHITGSVLVDEDFELNSIQIEHT